MGIFGHLNSGVLYVSDVVKPTIYLGLNPQVQGQGLDLHGQGQGHRS